MKIVLRKTLISPFLLLLATYGLHAQQVGRDTLQSQKKYQSLLWEISGNGMKSPSYLFGTMHVSKKLAFHLSDSFYHAIRSVETVSLELDPMLWQVQMADLNNRGARYMIYASNASNEYINEETFQLTDYINELKEALQSEPDVVNSLLYRSYKVKEDFEEDTFLDLYIYQTALRLGKRTTGVEDYNQAERTTLETFSEMAIEKKKDIDHDFMRDYPKNTEDAYKKGDLDEMLYLDKKAEPSEVYWDKFINARNIRQADAIDSILKHSTLFVGVGAAHLPGEKGVIELLRAKGYQLRPVMMKNGNTAFQDAIDREKIPVHFKRQYAEDSSYSVMVPGRLYDLKEDQSDRHLDRRQYADMANGAYYIVTRIQTRAPLIGQHTADVVLMKIDSLLYENIPGRILEKNKISNRAFPGIDVRSRTRNGDYQRYAIFAKPFEIVIFKMSGKEDYATGVEADVFFNSIELKESESLNGIPFTVPELGFTAYIPETPHVYHKKTPDIDRWEFLSADRSNGNVYSIITSNISNQNFIDADSFHLGLVAKSFESKLQIQHRLIRKDSLINGEPALFCSYQMKDHSLMDVSFRMRGPIVYVVIFNTSDTLNTATSSNFFRFNEVHYPKMNHYVDTTLHFEVDVPEVPDIDEGLRALIEQTQEKSSNRNTPKGYVPYWQPNKIISLTNEKSGETVMVQVQLLPVYYYLSDVKKYFNDQVNEYIKGSETMLYQEPVYFSGDSIESVSFTLIDTGSYRLHYHKFIITSKRLYRLFAMGDTLNKLLPHAASVFKTFMPVGEQGRNIRFSRVDDYFNDFFSSDTAVSSQARKYVSNIVYTENDVPKIIGAMSRISSSEKDYFSIKSKLITELGYIKDSNNTVVPYLLKIYNAAKDTSYFQNEVISALARLKTEASYAALLKFLVDEPPVFTYQTNYNGLFRLISDSLPLAASLIPGILPLTSVPDYKEPILDLLQNLVEKGLVNKKKYKKWLNGIEVDALVTYRKLRVRNEEKTMEAYIRDEDDRPETARYSDNLIDALDQFTTLLAPFYQKESKVKQFFNLLLNAQDNDVRFVAINRLNLNGLPLNEDDINGLSVDPYYRFRVFASLFNNNREHEFPDQWIDQKEMGKSAVVVYSGYKSLDSVGFLQKRWVHLKSDSGWLFLYRYRAAASDQWRFAAIGLQSSDSSKIYIQRKNSWVSEEIIDEDKPIESQISDFADKLIIYSWPGGRKFFKNRNNYSYDSN